MRTGPARDAFRAFLILFLVGAFVHAMAPGELLGRVLSSLAAPLLLLSFFVAGGTSRSLGAGLAVISVSLILATGGGWAGIADGLLRMTTMLVLLSFIRFFAIPIRAGGYGPLLVKTLLAGKAGRVRFASILLSHFLSVFANLAAVPVVYYALRETLSNGDDEAPDILVAPTLRGFTSSVLWSPGAVTLVLVLETLTRAGMPIDWLEYAPWGIAVSAVVVAANLLVPASKRRPRPELIAVDMSLSGEDKRQIRVIAGVFGAYIAVITLARLFSSIPTVCVVAACGLIFSGIWSRFLGRGREFLRFCWAGFPAIEGEFCLFTSIGLLGSALHSVGVEPLLERALAPLVGSPATFLSVAALLVLLASLAGVHPLVSLAVLAQLSGVLAGTVPPVLVALVLAFAAGAAYTFAPMCATVVLVSSMTGKSIVHTGLRLNGLYGVLLYAAMVAVLFGVGAFFGWV
jgi:uncharacterized membrane protein YkgB